MDRFDHGGDIYGNPYVTHDFSVNTNPLGMPEKIRHALTARVNEFSRYPDPKCRTLRAAISQQEGVPAGWILCGNGAADLIYRLCYAVKPRNALVPSPTFSEYERALEQVECQVMYHILKKENQFALTWDIVERITPDIDMLFLCNPNNPTGQLIPGDMMEHILNKAGKTGTLVVIDECFLDFTDTGISCKGYLEEMPNLVILKAFTKMYAMAGLRLGYLLTSNMGLISKTAAAAQCWSVSIPAQVAGEAALSCDGWQENTRRLVAKERAFLTENLKGLGITVFPSDANYILLRCGRPLYQPLLDKGILIRSCENFNQLDRTYYRICVKTRNENDYFIQTLKEVLNG